MAKDELAPILAAARDLVYPSESDAPFDPVRWTGGGTLDEAVAKAAAGRAVTETSAEDFFAELEGSEEGERWKALREAMERGLDGIRVFRVGERKVDIYLVGRVRRPGGCLTKLIGGGAGAWAGLQTTSVET